MKETLLEKLLDRLTGMRDEGQPLDTVLSQASRLAANRLDRPTGGTLYARLLERLELDTPTIAEVVSGIMSRRQLTDVAAWTGLPHLSPDEMGQTISHFIVTLPGNRGQTPPPDLAGAVKYLSIRGGLWRITGAETLSGSPSPESIRESIEQVQRDWIQPGRVLILCGHPQGYHRTPENGSPEFVPLTPDNTPGWLWDCSNRLVEATLGMGMMIARENVAWRPAECVLREITQRQNP